MKMNLRARFLVPTLTILVIGMGASAWLTQTYSKQAVTAAVNAHMTQVSESVAGLIGTWVQDAKRDLTLQAQRDEITQAFAGGDMNEVTREMQQFKKNYPDFDAVKLADADGNIIASTYPQEVGRLDISSRKYFRGAMNGTPVVSDALKSQLTGNLIFVVSVPCMRDGRVAGVFLGTLELGSFSERFVAPVTIGKEGYAFIMASDGNVLAHPDSSLLMTNLLKQNWAGEMLKNDSGKLNHEENGRWKDVVYSREPETGWVVGVTAFEDDIYSAAYELANIVRVISVVVALLVAGVLFLIVRNIAGAMSEAVGYAGAVAEGQLDHTLRVQRQDEIGVLADALRKMVQNLKSMIQTAEAKTIEAEEQSRKANVAMQEAEEARKAADNAKREGMLQAAAQLEHVVLSLSSASEQLAAQVEEASRGSDVQRERTSETAAAIEEMNATVLEVARNASEAAGSADNARNNAEEGQGIVEAVIQSITEVKNRATSLKESLNTLGGHAEGIGKIMTVISDIADQTNLLALNAAIEAARAGDAGRGFAVVADEVRKLAEKTMQATSEVGAAVSAIQQGTRENIEGMDKAGEAVLKSTELAGRAGKSLGSIHSVVESTADQVRSIATASEQQSAASEQIARGAEEINRIAAETSEVMTQSSEAVSNVARMAQELQNVVEQLKRQ
ncbi:methyl-accepting chemotaxis protein [Oleidesulfovibrio alaskensis]|uniref:methyl-accepting chemotaxis protein n=1 Tax=Oleidesulfovibrio alaskensis TaxID=58180 RepID=UPI001A4DFD06|nr:methyl-accepting chemotaxis protein [Oleidesulfovibrio alaskensis]MBL3582018.1 Cache 3/Cache 2 fusion domain-containing protein [Oleidesulfovibrio alaskensis]